jgi:hypothetical protein
MLSWVARYSNGSELLESSGARYQDIDRYLLDRFIVHHNGRIVFQMWLEDGQRLIFRRRVFKQVSTGKETIYYIVGWQMTIEGHNIQHLNFIEDVGGMVHSIGKFREDHPIFYGVVPLPHEM